MSDDDVWLVVLNWNGRADTLELLDSLAAVPAQVLVVDNGSTDGTLDAVRELFPQVLTLQNSANLGYAGGNNAGIRLALAAGAGVIGVLNNDVVVEPGFLGPLLGELHKHPASAVSPDIRYADRPDVSWFRGSYWDREFGWPQHLPPERQPDNDAGPFASPTLTGCCIVAPAAVWRSVGTFDDGMFLIFEDSDWSLRAREAGVSLTVVPASRIRHKVSRSFDGAAGARRGSYYFARNGLTFSRRHIGRRGAARFAWRQVVRPRLRSLGTRSGRADAALALTGLADSIRGRVGASERVAARDAVDEEQQ